MSILYLGIVIMMLAFMFAFLIEKLRKANNVNDEEFKKALIKYVN